MVSHTGGRTDLNTAGVVMSRGEAMTVAAKYRASGTTSTTAVTVVQMVYHAKLQVQTAIRGVTAWPTRPERKSFGRTVQATIDSRERKRGRVIDVGKRAT